MVNSIGYEKAKANGGFKFKDFSVLYRTNAQSRIFEEALLGAGIPYILVGGIRFYERAEIKDCLSYLRLIYNPADKLSLTRVLKIGQKRYQEFRKFADNLTVKTTRDILEGVIAATKYSDRFDPEDPEDVARIENVKELLSVAENYPDLGRFFRTSGPIGRSANEKEKQRNRRRYPNDASRCQRIGISDGFSVRTGRRPAPP